MPRSPRKSQWNRAAQKCDGRCWYCGTKPEPYDLTVDHAKPRAHGGGNWDGNLLPACSYCNSLKNDLTIHEFRKFVKVKVIRRLMTMGYGGCDLSRRVKIVFYGEGNENPFSY